MDPDTRFSTFEDFWPFYLGEHSRGLTRGLHFTGTGGGLMLAVAAAALHRWALLAAAPVFAYGLAWIAHFFVEKNRPATFRHPLWSLRGDFRMLRRMLGRALRSNSAQS